MTVLALAAARKRKLNGEDDDDDENNKPKRAKRKKPAKKVKYSSCNKTKYQKLNEKFSLFKNLNFSYSILFLASYTS